MFNLSQSSACPEGYICGLNTTGASQFETVCPEGYWCDKQTTPDHQQCVAPAEIAAQREIIGAGIQSGELSPDACKSKCASCDLLRDDGKTCYCPMGLCPAGFVCYMNTRASAKTRTPCPENYFCIEGTSPTVMRRDQRCPAGTSSNQGATSKLDCDADGSSIVAAIGSDLFADPSTIERLGDYLVRTVRYSGERERQLEAHANSTRRRLAASGYLGDPPDVLTFEMPVSFILNLTFGFDNIDPDLVYGDHYRVALYIDGEHHIVPYPLSYWFEYPWDKHARFSLLVQAHRVFTARVEVQVLHGLFIDSAASFHGTLMLDIHRPERASIGEDTIFISAITKNSVLMDPMNLPRIHNTEEKLYPGVYREFSQDNKNVMVDLAVDLPALQDVPVVMGPLKGEYTIKFASTDFWQSEYVLAPMTYLPYFSKCYKVCSIPKGREEGRGGCWAVAGAAEQEGGGGGGEGGGGAGGVARLSSHPSQCLQGVRLGADVDAARQRTNEDMGVLYGPGSEYGPSRRRQSCAVEGAEECPIAWVQYDLPGAASSNPDYLRDRQYHLVGDWVVDPLCPPEQCPITCDGGPPCPYDLNMFRNRIPSTDSHIPIFVAFENPDACHLVEMMETYHVGQYDWFIPQTYSDICDYMFTCMYEEDSRLKGARPFWFEAMENDLVFHISRPPIERSMLSDGYTTDPPFNEIISLYQDLELFEGVYVRHRSLQQVKEKQFPHRMRLEVHPSLPSRSRSLHPPTRPLVHSLDSLHSPCSGQLLAKGKEPQIYPRRVSAHVRL
ncbi:MAG: hypothetical protein CBC27_11440 [Opitutia bacterium TMED67]|nr:MAG: hypothetical protein CBC27_11440 [Opitutae bacterium TMED67]